MSKETVDSSGFSPRGVPQPELPAQPEQKDLFSVQSQSHPHKIELYLSSIDVASTLATAKMEENNLYVIKQNAASELRVPLNTEVEILPDFLDIITSRKVSFSPTPYWLVNVKYDPLEIFISTIEFFDRHQRVLPKTTIPPQEDVANFIQCVLNSEKRLTLREQFRVLMDIAGDNVIGAANLGFLAIRLLARGWDSRVYPQIIITPTTIREANEHLAQFECYSSDKGDAPGDTYYFWTHCFVSMAYYQLGCRHSKALDYLFSFGTPTMRFVRKYFAGQPTISEHHEASLLGRNIGIALSEFVAERSILGASPTLSGF